MARLNEPAVSSESIDSLKRRFVRQNRDLARCNSQQSMKIRVLENDLHHCLSENATLRTRILALETELSDTPTQDLRSGISQLRNRLSLQFTSILSELTELEKKPRRRKSQLNLPVSPKRSPQQREWRNTSTLGEVLASQGATMPTIVEGKHFPRRTLEVADVQRLIADADSPEVGPPPRTFLDQEQEEVSAQELVKEESPEAETDQSSLFNAVEIRRRRRSSKIHNEEGAQGDMSHPLKAGAKRKMDFMEAREAPKVSASPRKVLGDKSVNTGPVVLSPQKPQRISKDAGKPPPSPKKPIVGRSRGPEKDRQKAKPPTRPTRTPITAPKPPASAITHIQPTSIREPEPDTVIPIKLEPKTPTTLDIFSPASTQPPAPASEAAPTIRPATPPPSNITASSTSANAATSADAANNGRGSRRGGRPAISYAEPKINTKMRRPGKEMADAVGVKREERSQSREREREGVREGSVALRVEDEDRHEEERESAPLEDQLDGAADVFPRKPVEDVASPLDNRTQPPLPPQQLLDIFEVVGTPPPLKPKSSTTLLSSSSAAPSTLPSSRPTSSTDSTKHDPPPLQGRPTSRASTSTTTTNPPPTNPPPTNTTTGTVTVRNNRRQTLGATTSASTSTTNPTPSSEAPPPPPPLPTTIREVRVRTSTAVRRMSSASALSARPHLAMGLSTAASPSSSSSSPEERGSSGVSVGGGGASTNLRAERAGRIAERRRSMLL